jgi:hypothetical protein
VLDASVNEMRVNAARMDFDRALPQDRSAVMVAILLLWFAMLSGFLPDMIDHAGDPTAKPYELVTHLHAALSVGWLVLLTWQAARVRLHDMAGHQRVGRLFGPAMALALTITAVATVWAADHARLGTADFVPARMSFQLGHVIPFAVLTGAAFFLVHRPGAHKRLLLLGLIAVTDAGFSRWLGVPIRDLLGPSAITQLLVRFPVAWSMMAAMAGYDLALRGRLHPLFLPATSLILGTELLSLWLFYQPWWPGLAIRVLGG